MPDYKEGFKILANELDIQYHTTLDGGFERFTYYANEDEERNYINHFTLNEEKSSILNECLENCNDVVMGSGDHVLVFGIAAVTGIYTVIVSDAVTMVRE